jgi:hypothetical protein
MEGLNPKSSAISTYFTPDLNRRIKEKIMEVLIERIVGKLQHLSEPRLKLLSEFIDFLDARETAMEQISEQDSGAELESDPKKEFSQIKTERSLGKKTLADFAGILKDSPNFNGDPVEIQRAMRSEWD